MPTARRRYKLLQSAGVKQLTVFLSGEAGYGKTTRVRLLVHYWRSQGRRVLVCASTAKAARLLGGHTVHRAFKLRANGACGFLAAELDGTQHTPHWAWLYTRDIIVIDEISMLTAGALHGVNHALNHVMSLNASTSSRDLFGGKSMLVIGDLFQLPAVDRFRHCDQVPPPPLPPPAFALAATASLLPSSRRAPRCRCICRRCGPRSRTPS